MKSYWYLTRASGTVSLILLTAALVLGILSTGRVHSRRWPRFVVDGIHRSSSLLAVAFLTVHVLTAVLDSFAPISLADAFIPFAGTYRPLWLGLGAVIARDQASSDLSRQFERSNADHAASLGDARLVTLPPALSNAANASCRRCPSRLLKGYRRKAPQT